MYLLIFALILSSQLRAPPKVLELLGGGATVVPAVSRGRDRAPRQDITQHHTHRHPSACAALSNATRGWYVWERHASISISTLLLGI